MYYFFKYVISYLFTFIHMIFIFLWYLGYVIWFFDLSWKRYIYHLTLCTSSNAVGVSTKYFEHDPNVKTTIRRILNANLRNWTYEK